MDQRFRGDSPSEMNAISLPRGKVLVGPSPKFGKQISSRHESELPLGQPFRQQGKRFQNRDVVIDRRKPSGSHEAGDRARRTGEEQIGVDSQQQRLNPRGRSQPPRCLRQRLAIRDDEFCRRQCFPTDPSLGWFEGVDVASADVDRDVGRTRLDRGNAQPAAV